MKKITTWCKWFSWIFRKIPTTKQAIEMGLTHETNIYGDGVNMTGCRSFWNDEYGRRYSCEQLQEVGGGVISDEIKNITKRYFPNNADDENACYLAIIEALGKKNFIPLYINIEIPPDKKATRIFNEALELINKDSEGAFRIKIYEWMGWCQSCHSLRIEVCPIAIGRFYKLGELFSKMYVSEEN